MNVLGTDDISPAEEYGSNLIGYRLDCLNEFFDLMLYMLAHVLIACSSGVNLLLP